MNQGQGPLALRRVPEWKQGETITARRLNDTVQAVNILAGFRGAQQVTPRAIGDGTDETTTEGDLVIVVGFLPFYA